MATKAELEKELEDLKAGGVPDAGAALAERDERIAVLEAEAADWDKAVKERDSVVLALNAQIADKEDAYRRSAAVMQEEKAGLKTALNNRDEEIAMLRAKIDAGAGDEKDVDAYADLVEGEYYAYAKLEGEEKAALVRLDLETGAGVPYGFLNKLFGDEHVQNAFDEAHARSDAENRHPTWGEMIEELKTPTMRDTDGEFLDHGGMYAYVAAREDEGEGTVYGGLRRIDLEGDDVEAVAVKNALDAEPQFAGRSLEGEGMHGSIDNLKPPY